MGDIPAELLVSLGEPLLIIIIKKLFYFVCKMCLAQEISPDFKKNIIIPILKKASADRCENYGIISLVSHGSKILTHIIYR